MNPAETPLVSDRFTPHDLSFRSRVLAAHYRCIALHISRSFGGLRSQGAATAVALLDSYAPMAMLTEHGENGPECAEVIAHLISPAQRTGLREFYSGVEADDMNPAARAFRQRLATLIGEPL